jgi:Rap1a immunity proteins
VKRICFAAGAIVALALTGQPAKAQMPFTSPLTGRWFASKCTAATAGAGDTGINNVDCVGAMLGALSMVRYPQCRRDGTPCYCAWDATFDENRDLAVGYIRRHPDFWRQQAETGIAAALVDAFPCGDFLMPITSRRNPDGTARGFIRMTMQAGSGQMWDAYRAVGPDQWKFVGTYGKHAASKAAGIGGAK